MARVTATRWTRFVCWLLGHADDTVALCWSGLVEHTCRRCHRVARANWNGGPPWGVR